MTGSDARGERTCPTRASRTSNGSDLRRRNRTSSSISEGRPASSAAGMMAMRATGSGSTRAMGAPSRTPARSSALRQAIRKRSGSARLGWVSDGRRTSGSSSTAEAAASTTARPSRRVRTTPTPPARISSATRGCSGSRRARPRRAGIPTLSAPGSWDLHERDLVDLVEGGVAGQGLGDRRLAQEDHPLLARRALDLRARAPGQDQLAHVVAEVEQLRDGHAALVAGAPALQAAGPFVEPDLGVGGGLEAGLLEQLGRGAHLALAVYADGPHQPLGLHAVEGGDEVVGLDLHVEEAAEHVDHVVGVDGGEDQVAGEGGLDGDVRRLRVADLADHDLVRVVPQDRAQAAREGEPLLLVHRDLGDALELVLDRVLDGDDLVFLALDLAEGGVEGGGLAGAGRPRDQHHPVGLADEAAEAGQLLLVEAENVEPQGGELLGEALLVQDADDGVLAVHGRHDGHAEIDGAAADLDPEAAVLRDPLLRDVQLGHDLDAADDRGVMLLGHRLHGRLQHPVDAVLDDDLGVAGLDVDVRGPAVEGIEDGGIDETDDGRGIRLDPVDGEDVIAVVVVAQELDLEGLRSLLQDSLRALS